MTEYALYKGDKFLNIGTKRELAKWLGVSERTIEFYASPTVQKRSGNNHLIAIRIEKEDEEDEKE